VQAGPTFDELVADQCNVITGELQIQGGLEDLTGLETLARVDGDVNGRIASDLVSLKGLENLVSIGGMLRFDQTNLVDLSELVSLEVVEGQLGFFSNFDLLRLGAPALREVGSLILLSNPFLVQLDLPSIERVGAVGFNDNNRLVDVSSLAQLQKLGNFSFSGNSIEELPVFSNLTEMGTLSIRSEPLNNLEGLEQLTSIGGLSLQQLEIANLHGLENLSAISGNLQLLFNDNLTSLAALGTVESIGGQLYIEGNALDDLAGLENVTSLGTLSVRDTSLTTLSPLDAWPSDAIKGSFSIVDNPGLKSCELTALAAHFGLPCGCSNNGSGSCP